MDDDVTVAYTYDDEGMRTSKTVNGAKSTYLYLDGKLHGEVRDGHHIHYSYDSYGNLSVIKYYTNDTDFYIYYVMTNVFGDVISLHNANGTTKVTYEYDAWGNVISMTDSTGIGIGTINPIRYRGYYFDEETGLYYLASRYYDPETGRFINADRYIPSGKVLGYNLYTYCYNNPVCFSDACGTWAISFGVSGNATLLAGASIGFGIALDGHGNFDVQWNYAYLGDDESYSFGIADIGVGLALQYVNVDTVYDLYGPAMYMGASAGGTYWYVGGDAISVPNSSGEMDEELDGFQVVGGFGVGVDAHVVISNTQPVCPKSDLPQTQTSKGSVPYNNNMYRKLTLMERRMG